MRIIRFVDHDSRIRQGLDHGDGTATLVIDQTGAFGLPQRSSMRQLLDQKLALVADDDANMRRLVETVLTKAGCRCVTCADGKEAMDAVESKALDLIVSDIAMPHHNGYEIFSAARRTLGDVPVVLITGFGYDPNHTLVKAAQDGHEIVLYKPFTPNQLLDEVAHAIASMNGAASDDLIPTGERISIARILTPMSPPDIVCIGRNYGDVTPAPTADNLEVFLKPSSSLLAHGEPIRIPTFKEDPQIACEGELAVVLSRTTHDISVDEVARHILGYTAANDITARRWQTPAGGPCWMRGKGFDTFCPLGPTLITADEISDPSTLRIETLVNGEVIRTGLAGDMLISIAEIVSIVSRHMTLKAGTVILTGAPPLLGDPVPLAPGDVVTVNIDGIGRLENPVERHET